MLRILALLGTTWLLAAAELGYEGLPVVAIEFQPEPQPLPADDLQRLIPIRTGDPLAPDSVRQAIEQMYASGRYTDIRVEAEPVASGVRLRFVTRGTWFIGRVAVEGVPEPPNRGQLISASKLQLGEEFDTAALAQAIDNIHERLRGNGFYGATVRPRLDYQPDVQQVNLLFDVDPGVRARFARPLIEGVPAGQVSRAITASRWRSFWGLLGWKDLTETRLEQGLVRIRQAFSEQNYLLSRVDLREMRVSSSGDTVTPVVAVNLGPTVRIVVEGAGISGGRLRELVPVFQEQSADRDLLLEGMRNLTDYFQSKGYFLVSVGFETRSNGAGNQTVVYVVDLGERYKLASLRIRGNRYFHEETLRERMSIQPATWIRYRWGRFSESLLQGDLESIRQLYVSNGFRGARVSAEIDGNYEGKSNQLAVTVNIDEGPQWRVESLLADGIDPVRWQALEPMLASLEGQPYSEANLATDRDAILNYYYNRGFQDAILGWKAEPGSLPERMRVNFSVQEGRQMFVRGFLTGGLQASDPEMVSSRIQLEEGSPLSQAALIESQRRLYDLGVFARVDMAQQNPRGEERSKFVLYQFEEARKFSLNLGFGAEIARIGGGTPNFDAPAGEPGFSPRVSVGLSRSNLLGVGHTIGIQTRVSDIQQRAVGTYLAPQFKGNENTSLTVSLLFDISKDIRTFTSRRQEASVQLAQRLSRANALQARFAYRRNTVSSLAIDESLIPIFSRPVRVGMLSGTYIQDRRDDPIDSHRGYYNSLDLGLASKGFGSETDFLRLLARNSSYHAVGRDMTLARTLTIGWIHNFRAGGPAGIPLPERFFGGGGSSHRGFPDNQAGPRDLTTGFPLGGSALVANSVELRFPVLGNSLGGVLFHDMGNVYTRMRMLSFRLKQPSQENFNYMVHAAGFGVRYRTPVGPVRLDLAYGPNTPRFSYLRTPDAGGPPERVTERISRFQFHFSLGQTF